MPSSVDIEKIVLDLHDEYTEIGRLQKGLPSKSGNKDYSELEQKIIAKARALKIRTSTILQKLRISDPKNYFAQVDNINSGARQIEQNPYEKLLVV